MSLEKECAGNQRLIRLRAAAEMLGVSLRTLYRIVADGQLRIVRVRGCACIASTQLEQYMRQLVGGQAS